MREEQTSFFPTRRSILTFAAGASVTAWVRLYASSSDFWDKKPPAEWSGDEIDRLITHSPWAKQVSAEFTPSGGEGSHGGGGGGGMRLPGGIGFPGGGGGMGGGRMGGGRGGRGGGGSGGAQQYKGTVRWESVKPVQEALKTTLPESLAGH
jgi:hypothetical protein